MIIVKITLFSNPISHNINTLIPMILQFMDPWKAGGVRSRRKLNQANRLGIVTIYLIRCFLLAVKANSLVWWKIIFFYGKPVFFIYLVSNWFQKLQSELIIQQYGYPKMTPSSSGTIWERELALMLKSWVNTWIIEIEKIF